MFEKTTREHIVLSFDTGFFAIFYFMQAEMPHLIETNGNIVIFASGAGISGQKTQTAYAAAKEAIREMARVVAKEVAVDGITINIISPMAYTEVCINGELLSPTCMRTLYLKCHLVASVIRKTRSVR